MNHFYQLTALTIATAAALTLGGCNQRDDTSVGQKVDSAIATTERRAAQVKAEVKQDVAAAAPSSLARDRATGLAQAIKGVTGVDNRLDVSS